MCKYTRIIVFILLFSACSDNQTNNCSPPASSEIITNSNASLFSLSSTDNGYVLKIRKSWDDESEKSYILSRHNNQRDKCSNRIQIPVNRIIVMSASHAYMIDTLGETDRIIGYSNKNYTGNTNILKAINSGKIIETGELHEIDIEKIISMEPEIIIMNGYGKENPKVEQLERAGIPVIENIEWMEAHPLGRAEWIKVIGAILDKLPRATSIFEDIRDNYDSLKVMAGDLQQGSGFIYGMKTSGTWYIPGKSSFIGKIMEDAKIPYVWSENKSSGSIPTDMEVIIQKQLNDTLWLAPGVSSLKKLSQADERHALFKAYKMGNVFQHDRQKGPNGVSQYWAESVVRCDLLLNDLIKISRYGRNANNLHFYRKLED